MRRLLFTSIFAFCASARSAEFSPALPAKCRQIVWVASRAWESTHGALRTFERVPGGWIERGQSREVLLGERGLAWGLGLHETPARAVRIKREGDRCAPAGVFRLVSVFGQTPVAVLGHLRFPYRQIAADSEAVDDPASRFYNQVVRRGEVPRPDWQSSEKMATIPDYALGIIVAHNPRNVPGAGSCIFLHEWRGVREGTAGCTALRRDDLLELVRWLDAAANPVLVQAPREALPATFP